MISASNRNLKEEVKEKRFRADLYYRLSTFTITIPPLRNRREDILPLFYTFSRRSQGCLSREEESVLLSASFAAPAPPPDAKEKIIELLSRYLNQGLGRPRLLNLLREEGISISEGRFEELIRELIRDHVVSRGRGRQGIRLI